jgi:uncharacterized protein (TIGR02145 family)
MKVFFETILLLLILVSLSRCEKNDPKPNENWVIGGKWIDTRDGHSYSTVPIGDQIWMAENMAYLPFVNNVDDGSEDQGKDNDPFYYVNGYNGTDTSAAKRTASFNQYGVLYNYNAAVKACPDGWHLLTDEEWMDLELYLGMTSVEVTRQGSRGTDEGNRIKATWGWQFNTWKDEYGNGTNETGFTALPGGIRWVQNYDSPSEFVVSSGFGYWWSATKTTDEQGAWSRGLMFSSDYILRYIEFVHSAMSVRCVKN